VRQRPEDGDGIGPEITGATVQVPLSQFIDWAGRTCDFER
jgi:isocitrate/isopropylmalate dehydrogenase